MKLFSRIAALVLALALCLGLFSTAIAEDVTQDKDQITSAGGTVYYDKNGQPVTIDGTTLGTNGAVVEMTKTVSQPKDYKENEFEITLQVKTTSRIDTITSGSTDAAVLLIVDLSASMNEQSVWNKTRLAATKEALNNFVTQFASLKDENGNIIRGKRMIALVTFGTHAQPQPWEESVLWIDVENSQNSVNLNKAKNKIDNLVTYENIGKDKENWHAGTNIEAALMLGRNILKDGLGNDEGDSGAIKDIKHVYTILLTDGVPTCHVEDNEDRDNTFKDITGTTGQINGVIGGSTIASELDVRDVGLVANGYYEDKNDKSTYVKGITDYSKLYSICFGKDNGQSVFYSMLKKTNGQGGPSGGGSNSGNWTVTIREKDYTITNNTAVGTWLGAFSDTAYDGQSSNGQQSLFDLTFNSIIQQITLSIEAWKVTDTMGPYIQLVETYDTLQYTAKDNSSSGSFTNIATHDKDTGIINWDILASTPDPRITNTSATTPYVGYTYKYKVRLNNLDGGYDASKDTEKKGTPTNESATLEYAVLDEKGNFVVPAGSTKKTYTAIFPQPKVKGLVGELKFTKVDGNNNPLPGAEFTLSLDTEKDKTGSWTSLTATSDKDGKVTFSNIPSGHSYTLTEIQAPDNYNLDSTSRSVEIKYGDEYVDKKRITETNPLKITNTAKTGSLTISKAFGEGSAITADSFPTGKTITFTVNKADGSDYTTVTLPENGQWITTLTNVPLGTYTVTEGNATIDGYTLSTTVTGLTSGSKVTITSGQAAEVAFTNTYTRDTGKLTIKKKFSTSPETTARPAEITVNVSGYATPIKLNAANSWTCTIDGLPTGTYTITEDTNTAAIADYTLTGTTYAENATVTINKGSDITVTITNTYTQNKGGLAISKKFNFVTPSPMVGTVTTPAPSDRPEIVVEVKDANSQPVATALLNQGNNWSTTIPDLPVGDYTVTEVNSTEHPLDITGWTLATPAPTSKNVSPEDTSPVTITNTYERDKGSLTIVKAFDKAVTNYIPKDAEVKVTVTGLNNNYNKEVTLSSSNNWTVVLENLPTGTYTVKEISYPNIDGFILKGTTYNERSFENGLTATVTKVSPFFVTIENTYEELAELTIKKEFAGDLTAEDFADKSIEFTVSGGTLDSAKTVTLNKANNWVDSIKLPAGEYAVTEATPVSVDNYTHTVSYKRSEVTENANKVTLAVGATVTVTATNTCERDKGKLTIEKAFKDLPDTVRPAFVKFTVTLEGETDPYTTVTLPIKVDGQPDQWNTTIDLPTGKYIVTEQANSADVAGYTCTVNYTQEGKTENANTVDITKDATVAVTATNTYTRIDGGLTIKKEFAFQYNGTSTPAPAPTPSAIEVKVAPAASNGPAVSMTPIPVTLEAKNNWTTTIPNLPVGDYTVTEVSSTEHPLDITGWTLATPAPTTVTVASNTAAPTVEITNTYTRDTGSLTITKTISGLPDGTTPDIFFTVTGPDSYSETIYLKADQTQTDRKAMSMAADGTYSYQINNLPTGEYTVTETNAAVTDYSLSATVSVNGKPAQTLPANGVTVEVKAGEDNTATVVFTNTYFSTLGSLTIKKEFVNLSDNYKPQFIIIQVLGPTNSNFETTVTLNAANHWTDTIGNLPAGDYTVSENTDNAILRGYNLTTTVKVGNGNAKAAAGTIATVPAGGNVTVTFTNAYELKEAKKIELPITKKVKRGEKGNVDPTGARTFTFEAQIEELILASLDDTPAVQPSEIVVQFNGETLTPKDNRYTFSITVNGAGKETGTLTIFTNEVSNLIVNVHELSQTDSGYAEDKCWKYDESRYVFYPSIKDGINDKDYSLNGVHVITDEESFQLSEDDSITFTNVYTKTSTPEIDVPVTGDNSRIGLYMAMMVLSAAGVVLLLKRRSAQR